MEGDRLKFYTLREEDKHFLASLLYATGLILLWRGIWEVSYELPLLENVYFTLFVGLLILTLTGYIYREFDPLSGRTVRLAKLLNTIIGSEERGGKFSIKYFDKIKGKELPLQIPKIVSIEGEMIIFKENGRERFVPFNRITKITKSGKIIWKG
ncbi:DUF504 domain-containing protein [Candidatus Woesearchaeota archaeon]|nr:MAG: DUF504 domain-containing protein [Candidatus Woesearchaeota archaeon]